MGSQVRRGRREEQHVRWGKKARDMRSQDTARQQVETHAAGHSNEPGVVPSGAELSLCSVLSRPPWRKEWKLSEVGSLVQAHGQ